MILYVSTFLVNLKVMLSWSVSWNHLFVNRCVHTRMSTTQDISHHLSINFKPEAAYPSVGAVSCAIRNSRVTAVRAIVVRWSSLWRYTRVCMVGCRGSCKYRAYCCWCLVPPNCKVEPTSWHAFIMGKTAH